MGESLPGVFAIKDEHLKRIEKANELLPIAGKGTKKLYARVGSSRVWAVIGGRVGWAVVPADGGHLLTHAKSVPVKGGEKEKDDWDWDDGPNPILGGFSRVYWPNVEQLRYACRVWGWCKLKTEMLALVGINKEGKLALWLPPQECSGGGCERTDEESLVRFREKGYTCVGTVHQHPGAKLGRKKNRVYGPGASGTDDEWYKEVGGAHTIIGNGAITRYVSMSGYVWRVEPRRFDAGREEAIVLLTDGDRKVEELVKEPPPPVVHVYDSRHRRRGLDWFDEEYPCGGSTNQFRQYPQQTVAAEEVLVRSGAGGEEKHRSMVLADKSYVIVRIEGAFYVAVKTLVLRQLIEAKKKKEDPGFEVVCSLQDVLEEVEYDFLWDTAEDAGRRGEGPHG